MKTRPFKQIDVFGASAYMGNPLAVVLDGSDLTDAQMQHFAHWTNLSETTFLLPPSAAGAAAGAHYRVRIFTPGAELPFAGHPTLGSCHAWLQAHGSAHAQGDSFVQECSAGLIHLRRKGQRLAFAAPPLQRSDVEPTLLAQVTNALGLQRQQILDAQVLDNGPVWLALLLDSAQTVLQLQPDHGELKALGQKVGVVAVETEQAAPALISRSNREARAFGTRSSDAEPLAPEPHVTVRAFAAPVGVIEDPVTGSLNASLAQWLMAQGYVSSSYVAAQGVCLGRDGRVHIERDAQGQIWVGGDTVTCMEGNITL